MKKFSKNNFYITFLLLILFLSIFNSSLIVESILEYTKLFIEKLFPASFLFFTISNLLIYYDFPRKVSNIFNINGAVFYITLMSMISGFPSGSKYITDLYNRKMISLKSANYLIMFTHFPNPIFILGSVSILFNDHNYSYYILICLIISNLLIGIVFKPKEKEVMIYEEYKLEDFSTNLVNALFNTIKTIILIYSTSTFFYIISVLITKIFILSIPKYIFIMGIFDLTKGVFSTNLISSDFYKSLFIIFFISFGSLSINMQVKSLISSTPISYKKFFVGRILQFIISIFLFILIINWSCYIN